MTAGEPDLVSGRPRHVTERLVADAALGPVLAPSEADRAVTALYGQHYRSLVRLAAFLVGDAVTAEAVVQDSFVAMHGTWRRLRDNETALPYLRRCVVNRSRSVWRNRATAGREVPVPAASAPSCGQLPADPLEPVAVVRALRSLPPRQREALVLRYYRDLPAGQIAFAMGISEGAVNRHTARAIAALRAVLEARA